MTDKKPALDIHQIRQDIDRVDNALLDLIAERLDLAADVRRAKSGARVWRPSREDSHVRDLASRTGDAHPEFVSRIWAELMSASLALQGPMCLHIAMEGDTNRLMHAVRDRFGASIPVRHYPTASAALASAYADAEGVAVLPVPALMSGWWVSLCTGGAMPDMHILASLPRVVSAPKAADWPEFVAVATADLASSGADQTLIAGQDAAVPGQFEGAKPRAQSGAHILFSVPGFIDSDHKSFVAAKALDPTVKIIGCLPQPLVIEPEATHPAEKQ